MRVRARYADDGEPNHRNTQRLSESLHTFHHATSLQRKIEHQNARRLHRLSIHLMSFESPLPRRR